MCKCIVVSTIFALLGIAILVLGFVLGFAVFDILIDDHIIATSRLKVGTEQYNRWREPKPNSFKVYFFNITNPQEITNGERPSVQQVGPYVYRQYRNRSNVNFNETEDSLSYTRFNNFEFDSVASGNLIPDNVITVLNVPLQATLQMFEMQGNIVAFDNNWRAAFNIDNDNVIPLFHTTTIRKYLFDGYEFCTNPNVQEFCNNAMEYFQHSKMFRSTENGIAFSFFDYRKGVDGNFEILAGMNQISNLGRIRRWNNETTMDAWIPGSNCDEVRGTDSSIFPPFNDNNSTFDVFYSDICRIFDMVYDGEIRYEEVDAVRYTINIAALSSFASDRWCHCVNKTKNLNGERTCLPNGFEDMFNCLGIHLVLSYPHLMLSDNTYAETVHGLNSSKLLHNSSIVLEPELGIPLKTTKRMQFNMFIRPNAEATTNVEPSVVPILWFEEIMTISEDLIDDTINSFLNWTLALEIITWVLVGVGAAILVISIIGCMCCR